MIAINAGLLGYLLRIQGRQQTDFARQQCAALIESLSKGKQMADEADLGNDEAQRLLDLALAARTVAPERESAAECGECMEPIPKARQEAVRGCQLCRDCQEIAERRAYE